MNELEILQSAGKATPIKSDLHFFFEPNTRLRVKTPENCRY